MGTYLVLQACPLMPQPVVEEHRWGVYTVTVIEVAHKAIR